ncbi:heat-shock protein [Niabella ginsenosidivorans]|uniref:Heat-shock protein n=1 Tax=Niabella ginsenosidivorans TaxID=1176587 RepID=A0A1A9I3B1_9BACT|nr:Hsp20/alpha crystallin family protein [Niabella ginsenosidivorans]ANH81815.1 heat-shock protein [Niabella ginsenosidivorans]
MSLVKWNENKGALPGFSGWLDDFWSRDLFNWGNKNFSSTQTTLPSVNVKETDGNYEVEVAAPGMDKKDFHITLDGNLLTISSEKQTNNEEEKANYTRREFSYQSFQRTFQLPKDVVDEESIQAKYENGVLQLTIPKKEEARKKVPKKIEVQ